MKSRGFTLIELLVVISIVALLSSVVLASLNAARSKGQLAAGRQTESTIYHTAGDAAVGVWDFDECTGTSAADRSGYNNTATLSLSSLWQSSDTPATRGCSLAFTGGTQNASVENNSSLAMTGPITISVWLKTSAFSSTINPRLVQKYDDMNNEYNLSIGGINAPGQIVMKVELGGTVYQSSANALLPLGRWVHVVGTFDGTGIKIYFDGSPQQIATTWSFNVYTTTGKLYINDPTISYPVNIDNVRIYQKALTANEVNELFASEVGEHRFADNIQ